MRASFGGWAGLLSLCIALSACGGGGDDGAKQVTQLPAAVNISGAASADADAPVQFGSDVANPMGGLGFHWDFGDGTSSAEASPSHQFAAAGDYEVALTVSNEEGSTKSATFKVSARHLAVVKDLQCSGGDSKGWCWQRPLPAGNRIMDISFVDASTGWAVGEAGQILKTSDGGATWALQASHVTDDLRYVRFASATVGWVIGDNGATLKTTDAGVTWTRQGVAVSYPGQPSEVGLVVLDEMQALADFNYNSTRTTVDGGQTWTTPKMSAEQVTEDGTLWSANYYVGLCKSTHMGADEPTVSFETDGFRDLQRFTMGNARSGLLMSQEWSSSERQTYRTSDGGASWTRVVPAGLPEQQVTFLAMYGDSVAWAAADNALFRSTNAGSAWTKIQTPGDVFDPTYDVHAQDARTLWFRNGNGYYLTTDAGAHWMRLSVEQEWSQAERLNIGAAGLWLTYGSRVYHSLDGGGSWALAFGNAVDEEWNELSAVWFFDQHKGVAVGTNGWLLETSNGGRDWTRKSLTGQQLNGYDAKLQFVSASTGWLSGAWGVSKTTDGGASWWTPLVNGGLAYVMDFHFSDARNGWAISSSQELFRSADGGDTWQQQADAPPYAKLVRFIDDKVGVVATYGGAVYRTEDGGATWSVRPTDNFVSLNRMVFVGASTGWAVGDYGAVQTSTDAGLTWNRVPVPTRVSLHDIAFTDASHGWIVGDEGTVLVTADGGKTWGVQASGAAGTLRGAFFFDAYTGWIVGSDGMVLATATGGQ